MAHSLLTPSLHGKTKGGGGGEAQRRLQACREDSRQFLHVAYSYRRALLASEGDDVPTEGRLAHLTLFLGGAYLSAWAMEIWGDMNTSGVLGELGSV